MTQKGQLAFSIFRRSGRLSCPRHHAERYSLIAHLDGLTKSEFVHILATFPLVPDHAKITAQNAERGLVR